MLKFNSTRIRFTFYKFSNANKFIDPGKNIAGLLSDQTKKKNRKKGKLIVGQLYTFLFLIWLYTTREKKIHLENFFYFL